MENANANAAPAMIFLAERNPEEREAMQAIIGAAGFLVLPLDSLGGAVSLMENGAICDLAVIAADSMNDDVALFDRFLELGSTRPPPVVVCGVDPNAKLVLHCLNRGAADFLAKPFAPDELTQAVERALRRRGAPGGAAGSEAIVADSPIAGWIELTAPSELEQLRRLQRFSDALFASRLPKDVCEDLKMAVEEVGRNAVEWGNRFSPDKRLHVSYCLFDDRVVIKVEDEGDGFTPKNVPDPTADPVKTMQDRQNAGKRPGGYGVFLIQRLVDDIVYNEKGNAVLLIKYLPTENA